ncbi:unnamed protein product [Amoebophrya sp. A25]|nr:unnamed protein product [Amoebophrya sp. A25]|eukprot:GSA25T00009144001.1
MPPVDEVESAPRTPELQNAPPELQQTPQDDIGGGNNTPGAAAFATPGSQYGATPADRSPEQRRREQPAGVGMPPPTIQNAEPLDHVPLAPGIVATGGGGAVPTTYGAATGMPKRGRWFNEPNKLIPIGFILTLITYLFTCYTWLHLLPRLQVYSVSSEGGDFSTLTKHQKDKFFLEGVALSIVFGYFTAQMLYCYWKAIFTDPGVIPNDPMWGYHYENNGYQVASVAFERKKDGDLRNCKWCSKYKPDRTHHCRVLGRCVLKMDHHCPWIFNTVGFYNHKYFFLLLFNAVIVLWLIVGTFWTTVWALVAPVSGSGVIPAELPLLLEPGKEPPLFLVFIALYAESLAVFVGLICGLFFSFHVFLLFKGLTTIEFCEKHTQGGNDAQYPSRPSHPFSAPESHHPQPLSLYQSKFDLGVYGNIAAALGPNPLLWLVPIANMKGDGLVYKLPMAFKIEN